MRAVSITLVVIGHSADIVPHFEGFFGKCIQALLVVVGNGELGVTVFFVLSGFLITTLLFKEIRRSGQISIFNFYVRRALRIWPAFYVMLGTVVLLGVTRQIPLTTGEVVSAGLFFWNYYPHGTTWFLGHTWSLAVEEQFYLVWPLLLKLLGVSRAIWFAVGVIALEPLIRVANYFFAPSSRGHISIMGHTRADSLMIGALVALLYSNPRFQILVKRLFAWHLPAAGAVWIFFLSPILEAKARGAYLLPIGYTLQICAIALILLWTIQNSRSLVGRILNSRPFVHIGVLSYSIYLWQPIFLAPPGTWIIGRSLLSFPLIWITAECSYRFIEAPFLGLRKRLRLEA